jgi:competence protein ComEA
MFYSLLVKLAMIVVTMGVVFWIGWSIPQSHFADGERGITARAIEENPVHSSTSKTVPSGAPMFRPSNPQRSRHASSTPIAGTLDLNRASEKEIEMLPGIGPVLAERIVKYRQSRGAFRDIGQLRNVKGIGKKKFDRIRSLVSVASSKGLAREGHKTT